MSKETMPNGLDADGQELWAICDWIINGGSSSEATALQMQALHIRRELRLESELRRAYREFASRVRSVAMRIGMARTPESIRDELEKLANQYEHWSK